VGQILFEDKAMTRKPTEMEERGVDALFDALPGKLELSDAHRAVRAVIRAMREPTFIMIDEGATSSDETCMYPEDVWNAMIDAASPGEEGK